MRQGKPGLLQGTLDLLMAGASRCAGAVEQATSRRLDHGVNLVPAAAA